MSITVADLVRMCADNGFEPDQAIVFVEQDYPVAVKEADFVMGRHADTSPFVGVLLSIPEGAVS